MFKMDLEVVQGEACFGDKVKNGWHLERRSHLLLSFWAQQTPVLLRLDLNSYRETREGSSPRVSQQQLLLVLCGVFKRKTPLTVWCVASFMCVCARRGRTVW